MEHGKRRLRTAQPRIRHAGEAVQRRIDGILDLVAVARVAGAPHVVHGRDVAVEEGLALDAVEEVVVVRVVARRDVRRAHDRPFREQIVAIREVGFRYARMALALGLPLARDRLAAERATHCLAELFCGTAAFRGGVEWSVGAVTVEWVGTRAAGRALRHF